VAGTKFLEQFDNFSPQKKNSHVHMKKSQTFPSFLVKKATKFARKKPPRLGGRPRVSLRNFLFLSQSGDHPSEDEKK
jgi:hypothetical protein